MSAGWRRARSHTTRLASVVIASILIASCGPEASVPSDLPTSEVPKAVGSLVPASLVPASDAPTDTLDLGAGRIAFVRGHNDGAETVVVTMRPDGSDVREVASPDGVQNEGPAWTTDQRVLFTSSRAGGIHLFEAHADGAVTQLTTGERFEGYGSASPDGQTLVFDYATADRTLGLSLIDSDGLHHLRQLVEPPGAPAYDSAPAFSPDGQRVAFIRKLSQVRPNAQEAVFVVGIDGSDLHQVTDWDMDVGRVRWSPDGETLIFSDDYENRPTLGAQDVYTVRPDGSELTQLTHNRAGTYTFDPEYSPDGRHIVAMNAYPGSLRNTVSVYDANATNGTVVYTGPEGWFLEWPAWGPEWN